MRQRPLTIVGGVVAVTVGGAIVARLLFDRLVYDPESAPTHPGVEEIAPARTVQVVSVSGSVERSSHLGRWEPAVSGDQLGAEDSIRTGASSTAELAVGDRSRVTVADATRITVREVTSAVHRFRLSRGRIAVDYGADRERQLRIEDESGRAIDTTQARFGVLATGAMLAVATEAGTVTLRAGSSAVDVAAGEQSAARGNRPPSRPEPIPKELLVKLAGSAAQLDSDHCPAVAGVVSPTSDLAVDGKPIVLGDDGRFTVRPRRRHGQTAVVVTVQDALGRIAKREVPCRDEEPQVRDLSLRWKR